MSVRSWVICAVLFVVMIFAYDFLTKTPSRKFPSNHIAEVNISTWVEFTSPDKAFKAKFPNIPQYATASDEAPFASIAEKVSYQIYAAQANDGSNYLVKMIRYPKPLSDDDQRVLFEEVQKDMLAHNPASSLASSKKATFMNVPSVDFVLVGPGYTIQSRIFYQDKVLYVLSVINRTGKANTGTFDAFIKSFELHPQ